MNRAVVIFWKFLFIKAFSLCGLLIHDTSRHSNILFWPVAKGRDSLFAALRKTGRRTHLAKRSERLQISALSAIHVSADRGPAPHINWELSEPAEAVSSRMTETARKA